MRKKWNDLWHFALLPLGSSYEDFKRSETVPVQLPHDFLIADTDHLYADGDGWYLKTLLPEEVPGDESAVLDFDGVYTDADVLLNGRVVRTHRYGYTAFRVPLEGLKKGESSEIAVHIRHRSPNSRWYSGAGIFRDVRLETLPRHHMIPDGFRVNTVREGGAWRLDFSVEMSGEGPLPDFTLTDPEGRVLAEGTMTDPRQSVTVPAPAWSLFRPALCRLAFVLPGQTESVNVGFRETAFDPDRGFFLNGEHVKLHGVCLHHDLGALGSAFNVHAAARQLRLMRDMGVNAVRTSHNPPARDFLDLCDRMGFLVIDECYDMWELPKTEYDNARFFPQTYPETVAEWVRRDRCHPSVIMWSIGNEIYDMQASEKGQYWTRVLTGEVLKHDGVHARVTFGCNYMPWENAQKCADIIRLPGYNYAEKYYEKHHKAHPDWVIYGSETASLVLSRGIYHFPMDEEIMSDEDLQCSALMNSNTSWGARDIRAMVCDDLNTPYSMGQFIWSGIDYIGEPTPYHTRNSYFGQADTACFPKDSYYFYQSMWTDKPMIHIGVIWDWNRGQIIDVPVMTNAASAELFLNGVSLGRKRADRYDKNLCLPVWRVPFEKGVLLARGYDALGREICESRRVTSGDSARLCLKAEAASLKAGEIAFITVTALDREGVPVENACDRVRVTVSGGVLLGLDNGDSTDRDGYKVTCRRLFSGKMLIMAGADSAPGTMTVSAASPGLEGDTITLPVTGDGRFPFRAFCRDSGAEEETFIRRIDLEPLGSTDLTPDHPGVSFRFRALPETAPGQDIAFRVVNAQGVDLPRGEVSRNGDVVTVTARGDGKMFLRASANNGYPHARVLSQIEISASGFGAAGLDPYGFIAGTLSDIRIGDIGAGNEKGIAFARDGESGAGFTNVDFGPAGSDTLVLPIFALDSERYTIGLWDGVPGQGGRKICDLSYQKKSVWNTYQAETYRLPEVLTGVHTLFFTSDRKFHLKGFSFEKQSRAFRTCRASGADQIYGDSFIREEDAVRQIGNNVTLTFANMDFGDGGTLRLSVTGATDLKENAIHVRVTAPDGRQETTLCLFARSETVRERIFSVRVPGGRCQVSFVFLPGSRFDFYTFRFLDPEG